MPGSRLKFSLTMMVPVLILPSTDISINKVVIGLLIFQPRVLILFYRDCPCIPIDQVLKFRQSRIVYYSHQILKIIDRVYL